MLEFSSLAVHRRRKLGGWEGISVQEKSGKRSLPIEAVTPGTQAVALFSFQNKMLLFICLLLIYGMWKGIVVEEQFYSVLRLGGSPSVTRRADLVLALHHVTG